MIGNTNKHVHRLENGGACSEQLSIPLEMVCVVHKLGLVMYSVILLIT